MKYIFYGVDIRFPNKKKEVVVTASSLQSAKQIMTINSPYFVASCIYPEVK